MPSACIYARFSSDRQRTESIADQVRVCRAYAQREGYDVVQVYTDEARSGTNAEGRPGFLQMVADSAKGAWQTVIVYKVDRFARSRYDSATYKAKLRRNGVEVVSAAESVPDGPDGIILESVLEGMAEYYSANLAQNVKRGMDGNALRCHHNGVRLFGYICCKDGTYAVNEDEAAGVRMAFDLAAQGESRAEIARRLNAAGYRTVRGREWGNEGVRRMLQNERYVGVYTWNGVSVPDGMPSIVDRETFDAAAQAAPSRGRKRRGKELADYLLTGKLFDVDGNRFESDCSRKPSGKVYHYYRCRATGAAVRRDEIEERVMDATSRLFADDEAVAYIVDACMAEQERATVHEREAIAQLKRRIADNEKEAQNALDVMMKMGADDRVIAHVKELDGERAQLQQELAELETAAPMLTRYQVETALHIMAESGSMRGTVRGFVSRVVLDADGACTVEFVLRKKNPGAKSGESTLGSPSVRFPELSIIPGGFAVAA